MRAPARLALLGAVLLAATPIVPMASNPFLRVVSGVPDGWTCSLLDVVRESFRSPEDGRQRRERLRPGGCGLHRMRELAGEEESRHGFNGRLQCAALLALALLAAAAATPRWTRHAFIVASFAAAVAGWTWWGLRSEILWIATQLPGGREGSPLGAWIRPWPFVLAGWAILSLVAASWLVRRDVRRARAASQRVTKVFE